MLLLPVSGASVIGGRELLFRHSAAAWARKDLRGEARCLDVRQVNSKGGYKLQAGIMARG